jgi:WD40 repeat protein
MQPFLLMFLIGLLSACSTPGGGNGGGGNGGTATAGDWQLQTRVGSVNVDSSFVYGANVRSIKSQSIADALARLRSVNSQIARFAPELQLPETILERPVQATSIKPSSTLGVATSVFTSITQAGKAPTQDIGVVVTGPKKSEKETTYKAGKLWTFWGVASAQGSGAYSVTASTPGGTLTSNGTLDANANLLPTVLEGAAIKAGRTNSVLLMRWNAVPEAKSYVALVLDKTSEQYIAGGLLSEPTLRAESVPFDASHSYQLDVIATNIDLSRDDTKPYTPLPENIRSSYASIAIPYGSNGSNYELITPNIVLSAQPGANAETTVSFKSTNGVLVASAQIEGANLELSGNTNFTLLYDETGSLTVRAKCPTLAGDFSGVLTITSNAIDTPVRKVPVSLECSNGLNVSLEATRRSHYDTMSAITVAGNGQYVATQDYSSILIHDALTGKLSRAIDSINRSMGGIAWNPAGTTLAALIAGELKVIDPTTGKQTSLAVPGNNFYGSGTIPWLVWSPDGTQIAVSGFAGAIKIYNSSTGTLNKRLELDSAGTTFDVAWKGNRLLVYNNSQNIVFDSSTWQEIARQDGSNPAVLSPDGSKAAVRQNDPYRIRLWNLQTNTFEDSLNFAVSDGVICNDRSLRWSSEGQRLGCIVGYSNIRIYDLRNKSFSGFAMDVTSSDSLTHFEWNANSSRVIVGRRRFAQLHELNGTLVTRYGYQAARIESMAWSPDGKQIATGGQGEYLKGELQWVDQNLQNLHTLEPVGAINGVTWLDENNILTSTLDGGLIRTFATTFGTVTQNLEGYLPMALSPDRSKLAVTLGNFEIRIFNAKTGAVLKTFASASECCYTTPRSLTWKPDGSAIATLTPARFSLYATDGTLLTQIERPNAYWDSAVWRPDGTQIALVGANSGSTIFNLQDQSVFKTLDGNAPFSVRAWSPNGRYLLANIYGKVAILNATSSRVVFEITGINLLNEQALNANWNPTGDRLAVQTDNGVYVYKTLNK